MRRNLLKKKRGKNRQFFQLRTASAMINLKPFAPVFSPLRFSCLWGALAIFAAVGGEKVEEDFSSRIDSKNQGQESTTLKNEPPTTTAIACEREAFQIYCPNSLKIDIADGFYGRKRIDFCTHKYVILIGLLFLWHLRQTLKYTCSTYE